MPSTVALRASFKEWVRANTPVGTRLVVHYDGLVTEMEVCCSGSDRLMAYACAKNPGHDGRCFSKHKQVWFTPNESEREV